MLVRCKISLIPELIHLLRFESNNCSVPILLTEGQASMIFVFAKVAEKTWANSTEENSTPLHSVDDIFLCKTLWVDGRVLAQRNYMHSVTNSVLEDTAPIADS